MQDNISVQYARALFELSNGNHPQILQQLEVANQIVATNDKFKMLLTHPKIEDDEKKATFQNVLVDFDEVVIHFLYVLIDNKRINFLSSIVEAYQNLYFDAENIIQFSIISATPLMENEIAEIKNILQLKYQKEVILDVNVSPDHIGGLIVKYQDQVLDDSILTRIESIRDYLKNRKLR